MALLDARSAEYGASKGGGKEGPGGIGRERRMSWASLAAAIQAKLRSRVVQSSLTRMFLGG